ncbi:NADH-quinone oxidoreductase subunit H [Geomonas sp. RF6]|uniref:complex I subunit 1/NuoH family protein n=1 Tax=Geomonas sp. RF6 TaxID=2897342 RepID=UPI001E61687B|nr:complex I subunit 1 family protein [Geomonas sp. RF6]UFS72577.1 NADH-quinone oxidoreductase subunit H [Geomonas sp. RF6]
MTQDLIVYLAFMGYAIAFMVGLATVFTWVERKQSAIMADRIGANRAYIRIPFTDIKLTAMGLFHGIADGTKMLLKENFTPSTYDLLCYNLAPWLAAVPVLLVFSIVPFGGTLMPGHLLDIQFLRDFFGDRSYAMQVAHLDAGVLIMLSISGIGILGIMLAGWSSNNKFSLLGAGRAASQMISYEVAMGLALISLVVTFGTLDISQMVRAQSETIGGILPAWGVFKQPLAALLFLTAAIAENKRVPFDMPECESELVSGYFTEYTAMKMGLFMLSEFITIVVASALMVTLFLGGCNLPYMNDAGFLLPGGTQIALPHLVVVVVQMVTFLVKVFLTGCFMVQIRWSLPRFRYDQLLAFGWKLLLPLAAANLIVTAIVRWFTLT